MTVLMGWDVGMEELSCGQGFPWKVLGEWEQNSMVSLHLLGSQSWPGSSLGSRLGHLTSVGQLKEKE